MIPKFKYPNSMAALPKVEEDRTVRKSKFSKEELEDFENWDKAYFLIKGKHKFIFED